MFRAFLAGFDAGAATAWRTMAELVRAGVGPETLAKVIGAMDRQSSSRRQM